MLSQRLKYARNLSKLTQEELGARVNTTKGTISNYENGHSTPSNEMLVLLSDVLDVPTDFLLGKTDNPAVYGNLEQITSKDEKDIAKRLEEFKKDLTSADGLNFSGEPMSDDAKESLIEAMDHLFRQTQRINKKYIPKKHRKDED